MNILERANSMIRRSIATIVLIASIVFLIALSILVIIFQRDKTYELFTAILPLIGTWVGTVLAFYFGRENYEVASERYEGIIKKLTPDVLDDIDISQMMISKKTMTSKELDEVKGMKIGEIRLYLEKEDKSRLPIFNKGAIKYLVRKEFLNNQILAKPAIAEETFENFLKDASIIDILQNYKEIGRSNSLEKARKLLTENRALKDIFVTDENNIVVGWLTDTLIYRYLNNKAQKTA